jgi:hypothetical protein
VPGVTVCVLDPEIDRLKSGLEDGPISAFTSEFAKGLPSPVTKSHAKPAENLPACPEVMSR